MRTKRRYKGSNLFLVRLWTKDGSDATIGDEWQGRVVRVVDGESYDFQNLPALLDLLQAMISNIERR
jgi:hypothetical protein